MPQKLFQYWRNLGIFNGDVYSFTGLTIRDAGGMAGASTVYIFVTFFGHIELVTSTWSKIAVTTFMYTGSHGFSCICRGFFSEEINFIVWNKVHTFEILKSRCESWARKVYSTCYFEMYKYAGALQALTAPTAKSKLVNPTYIQIFKQLLKLLWTNYAVLWSYPTS